MNRILVTGGAGFIGSHTCLLLLESGYEVVVIDSLINSSNDSLNRIKAIIKNKDVYKNLEFFKGDIRELNFVEKVFENSKRILRPIKSVIHFSGLKSVRESVDKPLLYWEFNVNSTINLLKIMEKYECRTIVFSSSASIYGVSKNLKIEEESNINPINPYGTTKMCIEYLLKDIYKSFNNWKIISLRYFNPIGAHPSGYLGEDPSGIPNNIFPNITKVAMGFMKELKVFGRDWPTIDGTCIRDYIHVMDLAEGHIAALNFLNNKESYFREINLGTGEGTSIIQLINIFEQVNNVKLNYTFSNRRDGDLACLIADNSLAKSELNWFPKKDIYDMCRDGWNWQIKNPKGYKGNS